MILDKLILRKLSTCICGYSVLLDSIKVGQEYIVDLDSRRKGYEYTCGNCGTVQKDVEIIHAGKSTDTTYPTYLAPLPYDLFVEEVVH